MVVSTKSLLVLYLKSEVERNDVRYLPWDHRFSVVRLGNVSKERDGSRDLVSGQESEDTKHGQSSVVDLDSQSSLLGLIRHLLVESKRIVKVRDPVDFLAEVVKGRVLSGLTSTHVVIHGHSSELVPEFEESNNGDNLPLGNIRDGIPLLFREKVDRRRQVTGGGLRPGEDNVRLDAVSNEGSHGNTSVPEKGREKM